MATIKLDIQKNQVRNLLDKELTLKDFLDEILNENDEFGGTSSKICGMLAQYHIGEGSPSVDEFEIEDEDFDLNTLSGSFILTYIVHRYYGCDDMNNWDDWDQDIIFSINKSDWTLELEFPVKPVRDTFEEF